MDDYAKEKRTENNLIVRSGISEAETTNNKTAIDVLYLSYRPTDTKYRAASLRQQSFLFLYFLFVLCGGLSWLHVSFLLHGKYTISCRIVAYGPLLKVISATLSRNMCNLIFRSLTVGIL